MRRCRPFSLLLIVLYLALSNLLTKAQPMCNSTKGSVRRALYYSHLQDEDMIYTIYLPFCYDQTQDTYPVIYLLHGLRSKDNHWLQLGLLEMLNAGINSGKFPPLVVVMPYGSEIANVNSFGFASWERTFVQELMPEVESKYRVSTKAENRAIGGISRGGFWAYYIALRNPTMFSAVGGHSAAFSTWNAPREFNPVYLVETTEGVESMRFWLDRWSLDPGREPMDVIAELMLKRGLALQYRVYENGEHHNRYWTQHLEEYMQFYTAKWQTTASGNN